MANPADYDTQIECEQVNGVWMVNPTPMCYLPSNNLPVERIEIVQTPPPPNAIYYEKIQGLCYESMRVLAPIYIVVWGAGLIRRFVRARI